MGDCQGCGSAELLKRRALDQVISLLVEICGGFVEYLRVVVIEW